MSDEDDMLAQVSEILTNLLINIENDDGLDCEDTETLKSYLNKRNNDLSLAIQISQALLVKHENDQESMEETENKYNALLEKHESDRVNMAEIEEKYNYLLNQETEYKEIIDKTVSMLEEEKAEKDRISLERSDLKNRNNTLKTELEDTKLKLDDLSNKLNNLEMLELELKNTKSIVELKDKENSLMSKDFENLISQFSVLKQHEDNLNLELTRINQEYKIFKIESIQKVKMLEKCRKEYVEKIKSKDEELKKKIKEIEEIKGNVEEYQNNKINESIKKLTQENESLQKLIDEKEKMLSENRMNILNLNSQINKKENEISEKDVEISNLNNKISDKIRIISESNTEISNLKMKATDTENKIESLTQILDAKDKIISENKDVMMKLNGIINDKDFEIKNKQEAMNKLQDEINEKENIIKENELKFKELESNSSSNKVQKEEKSTNVDEDNESLYEYKLENDKLMIEMEKLKVEYEKIQQINEQLKLENTEKENEYTKVLNEMEELKEANMVQLTRVKSENDKLKEERDEYKNECQKLQKECDSLMNDLKEKEKEMLNHEKDTIKDKNIKLDILTKENKNMKKKLNLAEDEILRLSHDKKEADILIVRANDEISRLNKIINQDIKFYDSGIESIDSDKTESVNNDSIIESPIIKTKTMVSVGVQCNIGKSRTLPRVSSTSRIEDKYSSSDKWSKLATPKNKPPHTMLSSYQNSTFSSRRRSVSPIPSSSPTPSNASSSSSLSERPPWRLWSLYSKKKLNQYRV